MKPIHQTVPPNSITTKIHISTIERLSFGLEDKKSRLGATLEGTEKEAKKRQGQKWPGNFPIKIKVAPFVSTNH